MALRPRALITIAAVAWLFAAVRGRSDAWSCTTPSRMDVKEPRARREERDSNCQFGNT